MILITSINYAVFIFILSIFAGGIMFLNTLNRKEKNTYKTHDVKLLSIIRSVGLIAMGVVGLIVIYLKYGK
jgi:hypothetical protein